MGWHRRSRVIAIILLLAAPVLLSGGHSIWYGRAVASPRPITPGPVALADDPARLAPALQDTAPTRTASYDLWRATFPAQDAALQTPRRADTTRWALLVGINEYEGSTRDNLGSRQDAEDLRAHLLRLGWRDDHIVLLTEGLATRELMTQGLAWLTRKTDRHSTAVIHYSGHTKQFYGDADGDGEDVDEAFWPSDNDHMLDLEFADHVGHVRAGRLWIDIGACEADGLIEPSLRRPGTVVTASSQEDEKSYESPADGNSVWGEYLIDAGMIRREADGALGGGRDGDVTVQEAFTYAVPLAIERTVYPIGAHDSQHGVLFDGLGQPFSLRIHPPALVRPEHGPGGVHT